MPLAVIDVGSNTIKILVADGLPLRVLAEVTEEVRLSPNANEPSAEISPRAWSDGLAAIEKLLRVTREYQVTRVRLVATSMLREARNGADFCAAVMAKTGCELEILSGDAEARFIAGGVASEPFLSGERALRIVDLGGGSMEYIVSDGGVVTATHSWPLGAVRLTRRFFSDPTKPIPVTELSALDAHVRAVIGEKITVSKTPFVGCGGAFAVMRAMTAVGDGVAFEKSSPRISVTSLREMRDRLAGMPLAERIRIAALPANRADIFPAALTVLLAVADLSGTVEFVHSLRNLRYGVTSAMLGGEG